MPKEYATGNLSGSSLNPESKKFRNVPNLVAGTITLLQESYGTEYINEPVGHHGTPNSGYVVFDSEGNFNPDDVAKKRWFRINPV